MILTPSRPSHPSHCGAGKKKTVPLCLSEFLAHRIQEYNKVIIILCHYILGWFTTLQKKTGKLFTLSLPISLLPLRSCISQNRLRNNETKKQPISSVVLNNEVSFLTLPAHWGHLTLVTQGVRLINIANHQARRQIEL